MAREWNGELAAVDLSTRRGRGPEPPVTTDGYLHLPDRPGFGEELVRRSREGVPLRLEH
ncbi:L-alanine-DL-glutamate epimerase-like enolase superfamily enzyme [Actinopolymorpha pittospori]|uniref:L-alanine-DL-glutamate epimerase-like enolase superfamily enzyme n=1 Tax=Actinopolymorpha pittospori TaxID=648752 RepID=A0A927MYE7_9ACTN|nr:L-alanine-DL-glutamate epimerase-like enolase superfamily enzyme [Actinopolymorpha pittospori]